jgi:antirestriction protein ArdC
MTEKNQQEKMAAARQVELFTRAFDKAKDNGGVWLDNKGRKAPGLYQKQLQVSPFNAIILGMHADQHNYKTNQYTLFSEAKKRGESVQTKEKGVPFLWYNWNEYVSKSNPDDRISRADYQALSTEQQSDYKGIRTREVRALFNIEQTTLPMVDKTSYEKVVQDFGRLEDRVDVAAASEEIRQGVEKLLASAGQNMVEIRHDSSGVAHYDITKDVVFLPDVTSYENYEDYARDAVSLLVSATGHQQRLAREGMTISNGKTSPEDAEKQERLIVEVATAVKLQELGIAAKLLPESMKMTDYWSRELRENPCLVDIIEKDVNNAVDMLQKAERGEKIELNNQSANQIAAIRNLLPKHYYVADEIKTLPNRDTKEFVIVKDPGCKMADVVLPEGASLGADNDIPGMNKGRIEHALQKEGYETVTFYNADGSMGYRPDDSFFDGKSVSVARLNKWNLDTITLLDVSDAVKRSGAVDFEKILMMRDDDGKWALYMKPENEKSFCVYPDKTDVNLFFTTVKQGNEEVSESMRQGMAQKYYLATTEKPEQRVDIFKSDATPEELNQIERVNIFKTKATETQPSVILCLPTINSEKLKPREVTPSQWQRLWLADDMQDYKKHLAASLFADVLRKGRADAVAVGTDKSEQEAQTENVNQKPVQQEEKNQESSKDEDKKDEAKEETKKTETKAVAAASLSPMLKQFYDLKAKHPDAILLFRCGDFYETYCNDAEKASKILGITLTRSNRTKDIEGKPLSMAGFPYHALDTYLPKLIRAGERVAICDQLEAPKKNQESAENQVVESARQEESKSSGRHR